MSGQEVKAKIEEAGIALADVARKLSITPQSLNERLNVKDVKVGALKEIANAIGRDLSYFLDESVDTLSDEVLLKKIGDLVRMRTRILSGTDTPQDLLELLKAKDEIIAAQKKTIEAYEKMIDSQGKSN